MAQLIKKYKGGGTAESQVTSPPTTYPTILVDGKEIELTEDLQNWVRQHANSVGGNAGYWIGEHLNSALTGGAKVDTGTHTIESNINYDSLSAAQQRRMGKLVRRSSKKLGDAKQGTYEFIEALRTYTPKKDSVDHSDELMFEYEIDDKGNYKLDEKGNKIFLNSADSSNALTRLLSLPDVFARQDDFDFTGYNGQSLTNYRDWYNTYTANGLKDLVTRLRTGTYTDADVAVLSDLGYTVGKAGSQKKTPGKESVIIPEKYLKATTWNPADWLEAGYAKKGDDGYMYLTEEGTKVFGTGDQWLNDSYLAYNPAAKDYIPAGKGLFIIGNRIYNADDATLRNQKTYIDFVNANKAFKYSDANNIIKQYHHVGSGPSYRNLVADPQTGNRLYSHALGYKDIYGRNSTNEYAPIYDTNGKQLLVYEYFDRDTTNDPKLYDEFGHADAKRLSVIAIDPDTGEKVEVNPSNFKRLDVSKDYGIKGNIYSPYYQPAEGLNLIKPYGAVQGANWNYYYDPETEVYYYQSNETWPDRSGQLSSEYTNNPTQYIHRVPEEIVTLLQSNPNWLKDPRVREFIMYYLQSPYLSEGNAKGLSESPFLKENYPELYALIDNYRTRRGTYRNGNIPENHLYEVSNAIPAQAQGGVLKAQLGARMSAAEPVNLVVKEKVETAGPNKKIRAYGTEKVIGDRTEFTDADWWDVAALVADAVGIGLGYVPGAHLAGTGAGFLGSLAGFGADVKRDGFQWSDLGELGLNVGMDVGSIFAGSLAKTKKVADMASGIKKLAPKLLTLVNLAGMGAGVQTAIESFQNDSWTIDDLRTVVNSLGSIRNLRRSVVPKTKADVKDITLKHKTDSSLDVTLTKQEVDHINSLPEGQRAKALNDILTIKTGQDADIKKYQSAEKEFNALVEKNKAEAAKEGSGTKLWDEAEIAKTKKEFYESRGLDVNKTLPTAMYADYEGIDFRPDRKHWYSLALPGKAPKIDVETTQKVPLTTDRKYESAWDNVRQLIFRPALEVNKAAVTLSDLGISSPRQAFTNKPVEVTKPKEVVKPNVVEKPTEVPKVLQERVDYLTQLQAQRSSEKAPKKPNILSLNEEDLRKAVDAAKTKKQRQQANSLLSDYLVAEAKYKRELETFSKRQQKIDNEIAATQGQVNARRAYEEKVEEYKKYKKAQRKYDKYVKAQTDYENYERDKKAYESAKQLYKNRIIPIHLFVNEPFRTDPVYRKVQPGYYIYYKKGGKIQKGQTGLSVGQNPVGNIKGTTLSWIDPVLMGAEFLNSQFSTKKIGEQNKKALQAQYESQLKTPFREDSPIRTNIASIQYSQLNDQLLKDRSRMGNTSDAGINLARDLSIQEQANELRAKGWNAIREEDFNYRNAARTTALKNKLSEHEVGQNNYAVGKLIESSKYSQDAFTNKQLKDNETTLLAEIRNNIKSDRLKQAKYDLALKSQELSNIQQNMLNEFSSLSPEIKEKYSGYEDYWKQKYAANYEQYQKDRLALKYDSSSAMNYPSLFNNKRNLFGHVRYSNGGKTSSFNLPEKMILQNQKDNTKAFLKSKDNLLKILLKLMK